MAKVWFSNKEYSCLCFKHAFESFSESGENIEAYTEDNFSENDGSGYIPYCQKCMEEYEREDEY